MLNSQTVSALSSLDETTGRATTNPVNPGLSTSAVDPVLRALYTRHAVCDGCDGIGIRIDGSVAGFPYGRCTTCGASVDPRVAA